MTVKIRYAQLAALAGNLSTSLSVGVSLPDSLRTSTRFAAGSVLANVVAAAAERAESGMELSDALEPDAARFPAFFIPVIRCGEQSGRLDDVLDFLERHCRMLDRPSRAMRNTWLYPLAIVLAGTGVKGIAYLLFASLSFAATYIVHTLLRIGALAFAVPFLAFNPFARPYVDRVVLALPLIGPIQRDLALNRFFHALNLLYAAGGIRVEEMIRMAARGAANTAVARELNEAAAIIERGGTIADAFGAVAIVGDDNQATVAAGEEAGRLEDAFSTIARATETTIVERLTVFNQISFRLVMGVVVFSVAITLASLIIPRA